MTLIQVWGCLLIFIICPLIGGLPLIEWITYSFTGRQLSKLGTGNVSVSAAFYHGGRFVGILGVISEAAKGVFAVLLARYFFPLSPTWELIALIALVMGRYWMGKGAGTTNVLWGVFVHNPLAGALTVLIGGISFTIFRDRQSGKIVGLFLLGLILVLLSPQQGDYVAAAIILVVLLGWIYKKIPDDLDLPETGVKGESETMFRFFRGDKGIISLNHKLEPNKAGEKAATLSRLKRLGYAVPDGWVLLPGDDPEPLIKYLEPSSKNPLVVRSSAIGEDSETVSAAGQYTTVLNVTNTHELQEAILACQISYNSANALQYRQDRGQKDEKMAILIQKQIKGVFSGVAFSRDPIDQLNTDVIIEALPGEAIQVVSGKITPQQYQVHVPEKSALEEDCTLQKSDNGDVPPHIIKAVAILARELEDLSHGIPQDIEWSYDGQQLWLLQARPITTLQPIWTRKIASEVIPGVIRPLTWSINQPLTCGVWGELFTIVLGKRAQDLDFAETATLHYQRAYFNATLLGTIFRRMGLPAESLDFLTRGAKFSQPPLGATLSNLPGLLRLLQREWQLVKDFTWDEQRYFAPILHNLDADSLEVSPQELLLQIDTILALLKKATYYSILAPLSFALRQAIFAVPPEDLDYSQTPEIAALRSLAQLGRDGRNLLALDRLNFESYQSVFPYLAEIPDGSNILQRFHQWLDKYGYLSEVATDIAVERWRENPQPMRELFSQFLFGDETGIKEEPQPPPIPPAPLVSGGWGDLGRFNQGNRKNKSLQKRLDLKGKVTEVYSRLLAHLRWRFVALEKIWLSSGLLAQKGDIFFLKLEEIRSLIDNSNAQLKGNIPQIIQLRRREFEQNQELTTVPYIVYGEPPKGETLINSTLTAKKRLKGIGASPGQVEGYIKIVKKFEDNKNIDPQTILVVPYTDSGWAPLLARAGGLIAEVGGRLSHGAIIAREYGIPAVMDVAHATQLLHNNQKVRIDGQRGIVEIL